MQGHMDHIAAFASIEKAANDDYFAHPDHGKRMQDANYAGRYIIFTNALATLGAFYQTPRPIDHIEAAIAEARHQHKGLFKKACRDLHEAAVTYNKNYCGLIPRPDKWNEACKKFIESKDKYILPFTADDVQAVLNIPIIIHSNDYPAKPELPGLNDLELICTALTINCEHPNRPALTKLYAAGARCGKCRLPH